VKLEKLLQEKFIPQLEQIVPPSEAKIKGLMWRSADQIRSSQKGKGSSSNLRSDKSGGNGGRGSGGNDDGDSTHEGGNGTNVDDIAVMNDAEDNQQGWKMQLAAWKTEAVEGAKEASSISGDGKNLTSRRLGRLTSGNVV
jgi:hypothetical protein